MCKGRDVCTNVNDGMKSREYVVRYRAACYKLSLLAAILSSADNLCKQKTDVQNRRYVGPDLVSNRLTL